MKDYSSPKISVIMTVYNAAPYLKESIESILNQTYTDFEFIILNDGSVDNSIDIIRQYSQKDKRIVVFDFKENRGVAEPLNDGLKAAKGKYIARMDADDISMPERLEKQLKYIEKYKLDIIGGDIAYFTNKKQRQKKRTRQTSIYEDGLAQMFFSSTLLNPTVFFNKKIYDAGDFTSNGYYIPAEDYELWTRILPKYRFSNITEILVLYRHSPNQVSNRKRLIQENRTIEAKINYIHTMCGFMAIPEEARVLSDYFYHSSDKKLPVSDIAILFELFQKIINGLTNDVIKSYFYKRLCTSICMHSSRNNLYYSEYKKRGFTDYYKPGLNLKAKALIRQGVK